MIGLGGAEFRLPLLIGIFGFVALEAVILNKAISLVVVTSALLFRLQVFPLSALLEHWPIVVNLLAGSLVGAWLGASVATRLASRTLYQVIQCCCFSSPSSCCWGTRIAQRQPSARWAAASCRRCHCRPRHRHRCVTARCRGWRVPYPDPDPALRRRHQDRRQSFPGCQPAHDDRGFRALQQGPKLFSACPTQDLRLADGLGIHRRRIHRQPAPISGFQRGSAAIARAHSRCFGSQTVAAHLNVRFVPRTCRTRRAGCALTLRPPRSRRFDAVR